MGGARTAVSDATRNVYVEAAFWWPESVAGRSRRYKFSTDAGHRFERGVDPATTVEHIERITALIVEICGGSETRCGPIDDHVVNLPTPAPVTLRVARAAKVIGMPVTQAECEAVMDRLGFAWTSGAGHDRGRAAELALRPADRGRPDRGGDPPHRLRPARCRRRRAAPSSPTCRARRAGRRRGCARRWPTSAGRRRSASASSTSAGSAISPATPSRCACSTRSPSRCR